MRVAEGRRPKEHAVGKPSRSPCEQASFSKDTEQDQADAYYDQRRSLPRR